MSTQSSLKIAITQMTSVDNAEVNKAKMLNFIEAAAGCEIIFFPENCLYLRVKSSEAVPNFNLTDDIFTDLKVAAAKNNMILHLGSVPLVVQGKLFNSSVWIYPDGRMIAGYQKVHLFDIDLIGRPANRESDVFAFGDKPSVQIIGDFKFGESICYDVRFSELYKYYADQQVDVLLVPAAFLVPTGEAHWHILNRARAIESQSYVIASAQAGTHQSLSGESRETFGHALVVDPWGKVLKDMGATDEGVFVTELLKSEIAKVRGQIPMKSHRRLFKQQGIS